LDGPEWGYEIHPHHRSNLFHDLPPSVAPKAAELGYDYAALVAAKDRLFEELHRLTSHRIALHAPGGFLGAFDLLGRDVGLLQWLRFRTEALTDFFRRVQEHLKTMERPLQLGLGPRTAAFAPLNGYDFSALAEIVHLLLPKHYFWHRGFDGLYGTVGRYVETLVDWNSGLADAEALAVVRAVFGLDLPGIQARQDLDRGFPPEFFEGIVTQETRRALAAMGDPARVVPWVDTGRRPHGGDPMPAGDLQRILLAAQDGGLQKFLYHNHGHLAESEWAIISELCGEGWRPNPPGGYQPSDGR